jgi:hypothetical protein
MAAAVYKSVMSFEEAVPHIPTPSSEHDNHVPLAERLQREIAALKEHREQATSASEVRELSTWIDEAYGELHRARKREASM